LRVFEENLMKKKSAQISRRICKLLFWNWFAFQVRKIPSCIFGAFSLEVQKLVEIIVAEKIFRIRRERTTEGDELRNGLDESSGLHHLGRKI